MPSYVIYVLTVILCVFVSVQELAREEQDWAEEMESVENHRKLLEKKVNYGYDEAVQQLKTAQQQWVTIIHSIYQLYLCLQDYFILLATT